MNDSKGDVEVVQLISAIDNKIRKFYTKSLDISFNELLDMYLASELDISPGFQRLFQWSVGARSRFIESLLLNLPIPPIYVLEEEEGKWTLIDGLQRFSSYLHLRGELENKSLEPKIIKGEQLVFEDCDIVKELNSKTFDDLGTALQIRLKRAFIRVEVVERGSDHTLKYHMFKRLNTGGQLLTDQEIRSVTIRMLNPKFGDFLAKLKSYEPFQECIDNVNLERRVAKYDEELILRFFALKNDRASFKHDVRDYLTGYMEKVATGAGGTVFDYDREKKVFEKTFSLFQKTLGDMSFGIVNKDRTRLTRSFGVYHYEAFTIAVQSILDLVDLANQGQLDKLKKKFHSIKLDGEFYSLITGGGKNSPGPMKKRIGFVEEKLLDAL